MTEDLVHDLEALSPSRLAPAYGWRQKKKLCPMASLAVKCGISPDDLPEAVTLQDGLLDLALKSTQEEEAVRLLAATYGVSRASIWQLLAAYDSGARAPEARGIPDQRRIGLENVLQKARELITQAS